MSDKIRCEGIRTSGYWKGYRCSAYAKYTNNDKHYCKNHLPIEAKRIENDK